MEITGGDKLEKVLAQLGGVGNGSVNAGFLSGAKYPTGTPVAAVAFWNEYGHGGDFPAPPRPFMRPAVDEDSGKWVSTLGKALKHYEYDADAALSVTGQVMVESIQGKIKDADVAQLSETTKILRAKFGMDTSRINKTEVLIAQREAAEGKTGVSGAGAKPLNHTGHMVRSVDFEVKND